MHSKIAFVPLMVLIVHPGQAPDRSALRHSVERIAKDSHAQLGVGIELLETRDRLAVNGAFHYPMQSVYKLPIAMTAFRAVDDRKLALNDEIQVLRTDLVGPRIYSPLRDANRNGTQVSLRELIRLAVSESDGTASDVLLRLEGGPHAVMAYLQEIGVRNVEVATTETTMGLDQHVQFKNWTTPDAALDLLRTVIGKGALADSSRSMLVQYMTASSRGLTRIKGMLPAGAVVAHKPGTSNTIDGLTAATNDVGIVTLPNGCHLAVAAFLTSSRASETARDSTIARVARLAWDYWTDQARSAELRGRCGLNK